MDKPLLMAEFHDLGKATKALDRLREFGINDGDISVLSSLPYSAKALGRPAIKSRLPQISLGSAVAGLLVGLFLTIVTPYLYVIQVGGQPVVPVPTTALLVYEVVMLLLILGTFAGVAILNNTSSDGPKYTGPSLTDDRIGLLFRCPEAKETEARALLEAHGAQIRVPEGRES